MLLNDQKYGEKYLRELKEYTSKELKLNLEQVQIFTPTPSTYSTLMYYTEIDPFTGKAIYVEKNLKKRGRQKGIVVKYILNTKKGMINRER